MKTLLESLLLLLFAVNLFAQDSIPKTKLPIGVYMREKEFLERKPSIVKALKVVPNFDTSFNEITNKYDTIELGVRFEFLDSTEAPKNAFGFCDGNKMYWGDRKNGYYVFDYIGRFSFTKIKGMKTQLAFPNLLTLIVSAADRAIANPKDVLLYYNKKRNLTQATGQSIYWLIKDDKDFLEEWHAEKKYDNEVFKKYLMKMNERYPES